MALAELKRELGLALGLALQRPFQCLIQVSNRFNIRCSFCDFWPNGVPSHQELSVAELERVADELSCIGTFMVSIEGGEPFVRPDLIEIVRAFRRHVCLLYTNGWYVDEAAARALFAAGVTQVGISIDFPDAQRHDAKRGLEGTYERACRAVELLRDAAPHGGKQVHIMTVLMRDNQLDLEALLQLSQRLGVGHCVTLLADRGFRRGKTDLPPTAPFSEQLVALWKRYPHLRIFERYLAGIDPFLRGEAMPVCRAGQQSFNIDHLGNVGPCIEKIDTVVGNVRNEPLREILQRMRSQNHGAACQDCWTVCRGFNQIMGARGTWDGWRDLGLRMRSR
jgi:MoaA/NifB/PqqE/SkfB family radical SAM enzyme